MIELEQKILMWSLGFTVGVMTTIALIRLLNVTFSPHIAKQYEQTNLSVFTSAA
jgi:hypothetical protein